MARALSFRFATIYEVELSLPNSGGYVIRSYQYVQCRGGAAGRKSLGFSCGPIPAYLILFWLGLGIEREL